MRTSRTSPRPRCRAAAVALTATGVGTALLLAVPAHAEPVLPALPPAPQVLPLDTRDGLLGVPRGSLPALGTPDLSGVPAVERLPGLELTPLPATGDTASATTRPATTRPAATPAGS